MSTIGEFDLQIWFIFPLIMLVLLGAIVFFVVHFWRLSRARDLAKEQDKKTVE